MKIIAAWIWGAVTVGFYHLASFEPWLYVASGTSVIFALILLFVSAFSES